ncbi:hypothetical protein BHL35_00560 [Bacillus cereus]|nr:hypothetical protein BHL35_00560 [Bacillus cereus]
MIKGASLFCVVKVLDELQNEYEDINDVPIFDIEKRIDVSYIDAKSLRKSVSHAVYLQSFQ